MTNNIKKLFRSVKPVNREFEKWLEYDVLKKESIFFTSIPEKR